MANAIPTFAQFRRSLAGTPMAGEARAIYDAARRGNLNPAFVSGLASAESTYGSRGYAIGKNNPYGLGVHKNWRFKNYAQATSKLAKTLNELGYPSLYSRGGLAGVVSQYTPASDGNDESAHVRNILAGGRRAGGDASQVYLSGGGGGMKMPAVDTEMPASGGSAAPVRGLSGFTFDPSELAKLYAKQDASPEEMRAVTMKMARAAGSAMASRLMGNTTSPYGQRTQSPSLDSVELTQFSPQSFSLGGGPNAGSHTLGNWQSDTAYDLFAGTGAEVRTPFAGRVSNISGAAGAPRGPRFAGYGVTVDYGGGRSAFYKHLGGLGPGVSVGAQLQPGAVIGGLEAQTAGGPHLHLGATSRPFLEQLKKYYTSTKKR